MNVVSLKLVDTAEGRAAVVMLGGRTLTVRADEVALVDGVLRIVVPVEVEVPEACVEVTRRMPAGPDEVQQAIACMSGALLDQLLLEESNGASADEPWPSIVRRAVMRAVGEQR